MKIVWKPVHGFEGRYEVSNIGQVRSLVHRFGSRYVPRVLAQRLDTKGYVTVRLYDGDGKSVYAKVHRLVAFAFIPNHEKLLTVNHKDEVKTNNCVENLEWMTVYDNIAYSCAKDYVFVSPSGEEVHVHNLSKFCRDNKLTVSNMNKVHTGGRKQHKGWTKWAI